MDINHEYEKVEYVRDLQAYVARHVILEFHLPEMFTQISYVTISTVEFDDGGKEEIYIEPCKSYNRTQQNKNVEDLQTSVL